MVLGVEVPLHHVADGDMDACGRVDQGAVLVGDFDDVHGDAAGCGHGAGCARGRHHHAGTGAVLAVLHGLASRHAGFCCVAAGIALILLGIHSTPHIRSSAILTHDTACKYESRDERSNEMHVGSLMVIKGCVRRKCNQMISERRKERC